MHALALTVSVRHDWLDYLAAFGGFVGGITALIALFLAWQSKGAADRSAKAAEATQRLADEQVAIMRREAAATQAERSLRAAPEIQLSARAMLTSPNEPPDWIILTVGLSNANGTRPVDRLTVNLLVPEVIAIEPSDEDGVPRLGAGGVMKSPDHQLGGHRGAVYWYEKDIGPIGRREHVVRFVRLTRPRPGSYEIQAELMNDDLPDGHSFHAWTLEVPTSGDRVELRPIPTMRH